MRHVETMAMHIANGLHSPAVVFMQEVVGRSRYDSRAGGVQVRDVLRRLVIEIKKINPKLEYVYANADENVRSCSLDSGNSPDFDSRISPY